MGAYESVEKIRELLSEIDFKGTSGGEPIGILPRKDARLIKMHLANIGIELKKRPSLDGERQLKELAEIAAFWRRQYIEHEAKGLGDVLLEAATLENLPSKSELEAKLGDHGFDGREII